MNFFAPRLPEKKRKHILSSIIVFKLRHLGSRSVSKAVTGYTLSL